MNAIASKRQAAEAAEASRRAASPGSRPALVDRASAAGVRRTSDDLPGDARVISALFD